MDELLPGVSWILHSWFPGFGVGDGFMLRNWLHIRSKGIATSVTSSFGAGPEVWADKELSTIRPMKIPRAVKIRGPFVILLHFTMKLF
jgi:hypothetical protein